MVMQEQYMRRCLELAGKGAGYVAPNPMVGAVLVHNEKIIGEGWHQQFGEAHAEVNCINDAISKGNAALISSSVLFVSLEPCAHFGKTPPCADLIIRYGIPRVVIGCSDSFEQVNGKGAAKLQAAGVAVTTGVLEKESRHLNRRFFTFHEKGRPYIILKWAETKDGFIGRLPGEERLLISNEYSNRLVHQWRSAEAAILVGTHTALNDNPQLTNRLWPGPNPVRLVVDRKRRLPENLHLFNRKEKTIVFNELKDEKQENLVYHKLEGGDDSLQALLGAIKSHELQSVLVEGGAQLLQSFIDAGLWDEIRIIKSSTVNASTGIKAPFFTSGIISEERNAGTDTVTIIINKQMLAI